MAKELKENISAFFEEYQKSFHENHEKRQNISKNDFCTNRTVYVEKADFAQKMAGRRQQHQ